MLSQFASLSLGYSAPPPTTPQPILSFCTNISQFKVNCTSEAACVAAVPNPIPPYANFTDPYFLCLDNTGPPGHELRYARHDMHLPNIATHTTMELFDIFNGTHDFLLTVNKSAPGGYNCVQKYTPNPKLTNMPWSMVGIDPGATKAAAKESLDGYDGVAAWVDTHPMPGPPGAPSFGRGPV